jgi:hypothetical protein
MVRNPCGFPRAGNATSCRITGGKTSRVPLTHPAWVQNSGRPQTYPYEETETARRKINRLERCTAPIERIETGRALPQGMSA